MYLSSPDKVTIYEIADGRQGVIETLALMRELVHEAKLDYLNIRRNAEIIIRNVPEKGYVSEARALHAHVRDNIRYTNDINEVEMVQTPQKLLQTRQGDCDDKSTLLAALLESVGHPCRFVAVGFEPDELSHVYVETRVGERWFTCETTEPWDFGVGIPSDRIKDKFVMRIGRG